MAEVVLAVLGVFYVFPFEFCAAAAGEGLARWVEGGSGVNTGCLLCGRLLLGPCLIFGVTRCWCANNGEG